MSPIEKLQSASTASRAFDSVLMGFVIGIPAVILAGAAGLFA